MVAGLVRLWVWWARGHVFFFHGVTKDASWMNLTWGEVLVRGSYPPQTPTHCLPCIPQLKNVSIWSLGISQLPISAIPEYREVQAGEPGVPAWAKTAVWGQKVTPRSQSIQMLECRSQLQTLCSALEPRVEARKLEGGL